MAIHPTAVISPSAELAEGVEVGPYSVIGAHVSVGSGTIIDSHVVIEGHTQVGERNRIYPFVTLGTPPQDIGYRGEDTRLLIGDDNLIREYATIHRATTKQEWVTKVGDGNYLMAYSHIAHDCVLGNHVILANVATLGGHIQIGDYANLGGLGSGSSIRANRCLCLCRRKVRGGQGRAPIHDHSRGESADSTGSIGGGSRVTGFPPATVDGLKKAYQIIWRDNRPLPRRDPSGEEEIPSSPQLEMLLSFLESSKRGILR